MSHRGGFVCAFRGCSNRTGKTVMSFFCFPKDPVRAKTWLEACNREDLVTKAPEELAKNYKLCEEHFEDKFIMTGKIRKNLTENAIPTIFPHNKRKAIETVEHEEIAQNVITIFDIPSQTSTDFSNDENISSFVKVTETSAVPVPGSSTEYDETISATKSVSCILTNSSAILRSNIPGKGSSKGKVRVLQKSGRKHKESNEMEGIEKEIEEQKEWTKDDFLKMCDIFLPKAVAKVVKANVMLKDRKLKGSRT